MGTKYKDSGIPWIGMIPKDWEVCKVKHHYRFVTGFTPPSKNDQYYDDNGIPWVTISELNGNKYVTKSTKGISSRYIKVFQPEIVPKGSLLYSFKLSVGQVAITKINLFTNEAIAAFLNTDNVCLDYLFYSSQCCIEKNANENIYGAKLLNQELINNATIVFPPLVTQQRIADFLDRKCAEIDEHTALQQTMIDELKRYKQSVITEAVTGKLKIENGKVKGESGNLKVENGKMKDSGVEWIGEIPEAWEVIPFKQMYGLGKGLSITKADLVEEGVPVISYGQIHSKSNTGTAIKDELIRYVPTSYLENNQDALVKVGDIIFADTSEDLEGCGNCIYIDKDMTLFAGYHTIIASNRTDTATRYLSYLFKTDCWRIQIRAVVNGVKLFSIPQRTLAATSIITPPLAEQRAIADYLDRKCAEIDELIAIKQQKIEALKEYKKSVIFEYVTGKREVER